MKRIIYLIAIAAFMFACDSDAHLEDIFTSDSEEITEEIVHETMEIEEEYTERSTTNNPMYNDLMQPTSQGVFRGISFDMSKDKVYDIETARSTISVYQDETDEELVVTTDMGKEVLDFGDITYRFDEQGLYSIQVETYNVSLEGATGVFDMIVDKYTELYGEGEVAEDGFTEFVAHDKVSGNDYSIAVDNITDLEDNFGLYIYFDIL